MFVVVTRSDAGVQHAWGPFATKAKAQACRRKFLAEAKEQGWGLHASVHLMLEPTLAVGPDTKE